MANSLYEYREPRVVGAIERSGLLYESAISRQPGYRQRDATGDIAARFMIRLVAYAAGCTLQELLSPGRGTRRLTRARNIAIYLLHTRLSVRICRIAELFRRDRTTVAHACHQIEDSRDDPATDDFIGGLESMFDLATSLTVAK